MKLRSVLQFVAQTCCIVMGCVVTAHAGVIMEMVKRDKTTGREEPAQSVEIQNGRARIEAGGVTGRGSITLFKDDALYILNTQRMTYMVMDRESMARTAAAMKDAMAQMRARMANMTPEQRAAMENMMKQRGVNGLPGAATASKPAVMGAVATGATETIGSRSCKIWNITRDGKPSSQICVVSYAELPGKDEFQALGKKMAALLEKMKGAVGGMEQQFGNTPLQQDSDIAKKINGVGFIMRHYKDGVLAPDETVIKTWKEQNIVASQFEIPAGYAKQEMPMGPSRKKPE